MMNTYPRSRAPFTQSQWQELEHQALIFKYLIAGLPVPPDLLLHIRRSMDPISARLFHYQPMSNGIFQMGFGKKIDPEPGRCRRTDGKKWRCSKNSFPDSKYCERHMNRGRNRPRKPVEIISSSSATPLSSTSTPTSTYSSSSFSSSTLLAINQNAYNTNPLHCLHYPYSSSSRPPDFGISPQNSSNHFQLDFGSYTSADKDYRYFYGPKEEVDEHIFFSEASGSAKDLFLDNPFRLMPLRMSSFTTQSKPKNLSILQTNNYPQLQTFQDVSKQQHCFLGSDFRSERYIKTEREQQAQPLRHFFDDWPPKTRDSWSDLEDDQSNRASFSTTQLSISIPMASTEFSATNSQSHNDD